MDPSNEGFNIVYGILREHILRPQEVLAESLRLLSSALRGDSKKISHLDALENQLFHFTTKETRQLVSLKKWHVFGFLKICMHNITQHLISTSHLLSCNLTIAVTGPSNSHPTPPSPIHSTISSIPVSPFQPPLSPPPRPPNPPPTRD